MNNSLLFGVGVNISGPCFAPSGRRISRRWSRSASSRTLSTGPSCSFSTQTLLTFHRRMPLVRTHTHSCNLLFSHLFGFTRRVFFVGYSYSIFVCWLQACWTWPPLTVKTAWSVCVSRSSREESLWTTPSPCCLLPYDMTRRYNMLDTTVLERAVLNKNYNYDNNCCLKKSFQLKQEQLYDNNSGNDIVINFRATCKQFRDVFLKCNSNDTKNSD